MDEDIAQVVAVLNTTPENAAAYLSLADGNVDQAVTLFFENNGADLSTLAEPTTQQHAPSSQIARAGNSQNPITLDDDDEDNSTIPDDNEPEIIGSRASRGNAQGTTFEDDAAMARRLQEEMYGGGVSGGEQEEIIRAPIARQSETLLGPGADAGPLSASALDAAVQQRMYEMQHRRAATGFRPGIFNQQPATSSMWNGEQSDDDRETLARSTGGASEQSARSNALARLYQPPWDLMYKGHWEAAREEGRENQKWLLVNIQDGSVFACQVLNRDLWKNPSVVDTVKENFVFLQYSKEDPRAEQYTQYYFQNHDNPDYYPHIAIIDPRTGEQVKVWTRHIPTPADFLMQLHEFLDRYSLSHDARNPVAKRKSVAKPKKTVDQMSEEEQLELAMQASLAHQTEGLAPPKAEDPDDLTRSIPDLRRNGNDDEDSDEVMSGTGNHIDAAATTPSPPNPFSLIPSDRPHPEPSGAVPNTTRIQLKHPAGRIIRRFALSDPVQRIYEFLKAVPLEGKAGTEFELVSMGHNLIDSLQQTIEEAGLKMGTIMVEFIGNETEE